MNKNSIAIIFAALCLPTKLSAQDTTPIPHGEGSGESLTVSLSADVVNQYIWRGQELGNTALQPGLGVACKGLSLSAWGSTALTDAADTKEFDLTLGYSLGGLNIGVTDYWFNTPQEKYFSYRNGLTSHVFEANVGYDFGLASVQWFTNIGGNDGVNASGKRAYSSYVELAAPFRLGGAAWTAAVGAVPYATDFYGTDGFAITNASLRATADIAVTDKFSVPVFAGIVANPHAGKVWLVVGLTLQP